MHISRVLFGGENVTQGLDWLCSQMFLTPFCSYCQLLEPFFCSGPLLLLCRMKLSQPKLFWPFTKSMNYSIWLLKIMPEILKCTKYASASPSSCKANCNQSHYREVPWWEIFMEQELRLGKLSYLHSFKIFWLMKSPFTSKVFLINVAHFDLSKTYRI